MSHLIQRLQTEEKIHCPKWLPSNCHYLTIMGSTAYGANTDDSDVDYYGWCIEPLEYIFPSSRGLVLGFDDIPKFEVWQEHHVKDDKYQRDFQIFGIVKYFKLLADNNPNVVDSIFTPLDCVQTNSRIGQIVRLNRKKFLHKGVWHRYRGYSYSQLHKVDSTGEKTGKRKEMREKYGFDCKFLSHVVRLMLECEQILTECDLDLRRNSDLLKAIKRGEWTPQQTKEWFSNKEKELEQIYHKSNLPYTCDKQEIRGILLNCLEEHYGSLNKFVRVESNADKILNQIQELLHART